MTEKEPLLEKKDVSKIQSVENLDLIIADNTNYEDMIKLTNNTKTVISCAGPFAVYGSVLVNCCAAYGTDYVDITGEIDWVRKMIASYQDLAFESGARIVSCCGFDCVPFDIMLYKLNQKLNENKKAEIQSLEIWDDGIFGGLSGGTVNSLMNSFSTKTDQKSSNKSISFDPLNKLPNNRREDGTIETFDQPRGNKCINLSKKMMHYDNTIKKWCGFNWIILQNFRMIQRTNNLLNYSPKLTYNEKIVYPGFMVGF